MKASAGKVSATTSTPGRQAGRLGVGALVDGGARRDETSGTLWSALAMRLHGAAASPHEDQANRSAHEPATAAPPLPTPPGTPSEVAMVVAGLGAGRPLREPEESRLAQVPPPAVRAVRVHEGEEAARRAAILGADAFTAGTHVVLGRPSAGDAGRWLMAHELAHVAQQYTGAARVQAHVTDSPAGRIGGASEFVHGQGAEGRYLFTQRGGWLDRSHVEAHVGASNAVLAQLEARAPAVTAQTNAFTTTYTMNYGQVPPPAEANLTPVALAILTDHDARFEAYQNSSASDVLAQTPFSYEDMTSNRFGSLVGIAWRSAARNQGIDPDAPIAPGSPAEALQRQVMAQMVNLLDPTSGERGRQIYYGWLESQGMPVPRAAARVERAAGDVGAWLFPEIGPAIRRASELPQQAREYSPLLDQPRNYTPAPYVDSVLSPVTSPHGLLTATLPPWAWAAAGIDSNYLGRAVRELNRPLRP